MNNEQSPEHTAPDAEEETNTTDVREAIQRSRDVRTDESPVPPVSEDVHSSVDAAPPTTITPSEHASVNTEPYTVREDLQMPSAGAASVTADDVVTAEPPAQTVATPPAQTAPAANQVSIDADHPMAALYIQQPMPPTSRGNRLGGVLISLLATLGFALVYAGALAVYLAPTFPPSTFLQEGLLPFLTSLGFVLPVGAFFVGMVILVLIFNRAGWWAYVLGGFVVALLVWVAAAAGYALSPQLTGQDFGLGVTQVLSMATTIPVLIAAITAREVSTWFGAWIGARGRKIKARNAQVYAEYETKLQEVQAKVA